MLLLVILIIILYYKVQKYINKYNNINIICNKDYVDSVTANQRIIIEPRTFSYTRSVRFVISGEAFLIFLAHNGKTYKMPSSRVSIRI